MWILLPNIDLRCFVAKQFLSRIYTLFWCTFYRPKKCVGVQKMTNMRYGLLVQHFFSSPNIRIIFVLTGNRKGYRKQKSGSVCKKIILAAITKSRQVQFSFSFCNKVLNRNFLCIVDHLQKDTLFLFMIPYMDGCQLRRQLKPHSFIRVSLE